MKSRDRSLVLTATLSFLAGGLAGAGVALLTAPESGRTTRQRIAGSVRNGAGRVRSMKDSAVLRGMMIRDETQRRIQEATSHIFGRRGVEAPPEAVAAGNGQAEPIPFEG